MLKPARAKSRIVASCSEPLGIPSLSVLAMALRDLPVEARALAGVTDIALAEPRHFQQDRVLVAVGQERGHLQAVARGFPFGPQRVPRTAEKGREPRVQG